MPSKHPKKNWSFIKKLAFKTVFTHLILFVLFIFLSPLLETLLRWFAEYILNWGADFRMQSTGSGDRSFDYVKLGFDVFLTVFIVVIWSFYDNKRPSYNRLFYWFKVFLRIVLFLTMLLYGFGKIFKGQFADPSLELLVQTVGEMSPMGLAWTFMGHSFAYNIFIGFAEVLGGVLVLFKRTKTLGSMIIIGVMTNVTMMNFTYDIPVKLVSIHLVLMASVLLISDRKRLLNIFFKNKIAAPVNYDVSFKNATLKKVISIIKISVVFLITGIIIVQCFIQFDITKQLKSSSELYGIWDAQLFIKNKDTLPPLITDAYRWRYLIIDQKKKAVVKKMNDSIDRYIFKINVEQKEAIFQRTEDSLPHRFLYTLVNSEDLLLQGTLDGDSLYIKFKRKPVTDFRLFTRKFHWINESTYKH